jgi:hypothetical protein
MRELQPHAKRHRVIETLFEKLKEFNISLWATIRSHLEDVKSLSSLQEQCLDSNETAGIEEAVKQDTHIGSD